MAGVWSPASVLAPQDTISQLQFGPDNLLALASWDGCVRVCNVQGDWSAQWQTSRPQFSVSWDMVSAKLYFGGAESRVSVIDCEAEVQYDLAAAPLVVTSLATSTQSLFVGTTQGASSLDQRKATPAAVFTSGVGTIALDVEPGGTTLVAAGADGQCRVWDTRNAIKPLTCQKPFRSDSPLLSVKLAQDARVYAVSNQESHVAVAYPNTPDRSFVFKTNRIIPEIGAARMYPVYALDYQAGVLTAAGGDKSICVWDIEQRKLMRRISFSMPCVSVSYSRGGEFCAVGLSNDAWMNTRAKFCERSRAKVMLSKLEF